MIHTWYVSLKSYVSYEGAHTAAVLRLYDYKTYQVHRSKKTKRVRRHRVFEQSTSSSNSSP